MSELPTPSQTQTRVEEALWILLVWSVVLIVVALPLLFNPWSFFFVYSRPKLRALLILVGLSAAAALMLLFRRRGALRLPRGVIVPLLVYAVALALSTLLAPQRHFAIWGQPRRYEGLIPSEAYLLVFALTTAAFLARDIARRWQILLVGAAALVGAYAVIQYFGIEPFIPWIPKGERPVATFGNPGWLAAFAVLVLPMAVAGAWRAGSGLALAGRLGAIALICLGLLCSYTRVAWGSAILALGVVISTIGGWRVYVRTRNVVASVALLAVVIAVFFWPKGVFVQALGSPLGRTDPDLAAGDMRQRIVIWRKMVRLVAARPLFGYGPDNLAIRIERTDPGGIEAFPQLKSSTVEAFLVNRAHNELLQIAGATGVIGLAAYLWLVVSILVMLWRRLGTLGPRAPLAAGLLAGLLGFLLLVQMQPTSLGVSAVFWAMLGVAAALAEQGGTGPELPPRG